MDEGWREFGQVVAFGADIADADIMGPDSERAEAASEGVFGEGLRFHWVGFAVDGPRAVWQGTEGSNQGAGEEAVGGAGGQHDVIRIAARDLGEEFRAVHGVGPGLDDGQVNRVRLSSRGWGLRVASCRLQVESCGRFEEFKVWIHRMSLLFGLRGGLCRPTLMQPG